MFGFCQSLERETAWNESKEKYTGHLFHIVASERGRKIERERERERERKRKRKKGRKNMRSEN